MSLAEKWEEYRRSLDYEAKNTSWETTIDRLQRAFYAGAEAALTPDGKTPMQHQEECRAEIDRFKGEK